MPIRNLLLITSRYPSKRHPMDGAFIQQFVAGLCGLGINVTVVHPVALHRAKDYNGELFIRGLISCHETVYRPYYLSLSSRKFGFINTEKLTQWMYSSAVLRAVRFLEGIPDIIYGHFLYPSGAAAVQCGKILSRPVFIGVGESYLHTFTLEKIKRANKDFHTCAGFISVSSFNKDFLTSQLDIPKNKVAIFINGVDTNLFLPRPKVEVRDALKIPKDMFVVAFVGAFNHRKGVQRLSQAIQDLENTGALYIGDGPLQPEPGGCLFKGAVPHAQVPELLAAADIFVLPTLSEGCSNAILEALACGLPVVSSIGEFNDDILNDAVSIRVNPQNIDEIRSAICKLRASPDLRNQMSQNAVQWAQKFNISRRIETILDFMNQM